MAAAAPPLSGNSVPLSSDNVSFADTMDVHTDHRVDGDGNMNVDTSSERALDRRDDDDLSLQDAGTDGDADIRTATEDQDDYMVDNDDLIDYDDADYDLVLEDAGDASVGSLADAQDEATVPVNLANSADAPGTVFDEDLIDYSDDEDQPQESFEAVANVEVSEQQHVSAVQPPSPPHVPADDLHNDSTADEGADNAADVYADEGEGAAHQEWPQTWGQGEEEQWDQPQTDATYAETAQADEDEGQAEEQQQQGGLSGDSHEPSAVAQNHEVDKDPNTDVDTTEDGKDANARFPPQGPQDETVDPSYSEADNVDAGPTLQSGALYPVTVNYNGAESWLFKPRDFDTDDWLLEDESIANEPFLYLIHACRAKLNDQLGNETELGLRFDSFQGLELYEDCTACAYSTLNEFLDIYTTLHSQDDQTDPEPFYVTLQFRPRVSALVSDLKKAVQEGIGFSGLRRAIDAGLNHFSMLSSGNYVDEYNEQWEEEGEGEVEHEEYHASEGEHEEQYTGEGEQKDRYAGADEQEDQYAGADKEEDQYEAEGEGEGAYEQEDEVYGQEGVALEEDFEGAERTGQVPEQGNGEPSHDLVEAEDADADQLPQQPATHGTDADVIQKEETPSKASANATPGPLATSRTPETTAHYDQADDDYIDYSDDEEEDVKQSDRRSARETSSTSATLRGDEPSDGERSTNLLEPNTEDGHQDLPHTGDEGVQSTTVHAEEAFPAEYEDVEQGDQADSEFVQPDNGEEEFEEGFEEEDEYNAFDFEEDEHGGAESTYADGQSYPSDQGEGEAGQPYGTFQQAVANEDETDFNDVDDEFGAEQTDQPVVQPGRVDDEFDLDFDDQTAMTEPVEVIATVAALSKAAPSAGLNDLGSPQGQKRPLDEVDGGLDGAGDPTDAKKMKV
ncbi:uncharacterized protein EI97DRAFT_457944 [Westerdykella ornata]|uniref:Uncharacterized protein n=1 Tax=Westerdykella ornata TaxID=318751 RepID=A0A6A6JKX6_WESOR|nr:uncharacterized protein EI97DRAFT_457944 [Westerdykella ornata]KAF2277241.1 hypothetical protein EI97DRAFT_457944 [Westerdykella ornata]